MALNNHALNQPSSKGYSTMRFTAFPSFAAVIIVLHCMSQIYAGWSENMGSKDKQKLGGIVSDKLKIPMDLGFFVKYKNKRGRRLAKRWAKDGEVDKNIPKQSIFALRVSNKTALNKLLKSPNIAYVEPVHKVRAQGHRLRHRHRHKRRELELHPHELVGYGISMTQASDLWDIPPVSDITICIIDSGYDLGHIDLPNLENNVTGTSTAWGDWFEDSYGHGTHVAGIIGAIGDNNRGVVGIMGYPTRFRFHIGKALNGYGLGKESDLLAAFQGCIDANATVISMSLGIDENSTTVETACKEAYDDGILIVASAGNQGNSAYSFPASYPHVMSVTAVDEFMKFAQFSQYNDQVEIAGPGVDITSTVPISSNGKGYGLDRWSGTSMASANVAGVAALVWQYYPECSNNQIRNVLVRTAKKSKDYIGCSYEFGYGIVQAKDAYDLLKKEGCEAGDASPTPLSDGGVGGCSQDPLYVPPPTTSPTAFICEDKVFLFELTTDEYGEETFWELKNSKDEFVGSGGGYLSSKSYTERMCLPQEQYTFTVHDLEGDGLCCDFGFGVFSVYYDGVLIGTGGNFTDAERISFGETNNSEEPALLTASPTSLRTPESALPRTATLTSSPTASPTPLPTQKPALPPTALLTAKPTAPPTASSTPQPSLLPTLSPDWTKQSIPPTVAPTTTPPTIAPQDSLDTSIPGVSIPLTLSPTSTSHPVCKDDRGWIHKTYGGKHKKCKFVAREPEVRCKRMGIDSHGKRTSGYASCPLSCGSCLLKRAEPSLLPATAPNSSPTITPTPEPTLLPISPLTTSPTPKKVVLSSFRPTRISARSPTPPVLSTLQPTAYPTPFPSEKLPCAVQCCNPTDSGNGGWANEYMLSVCAKEGCAYRDNGNGRGPYCSDNGYYDKCMAHFCGVTLSRTQPPVPSKSPTLQPSISPTPKFQIAKPTKRNASLGIRKTVAFSSKQCPSSSEPRGAGDVKIVEVKEGTEIVWCFKITNTGMVRLSAVRLMDVDIGFSDLTKGLDVGASWYVHKRWNATKSLRNKGEAWGHIRLEKGSNSSKVNAIVPTESTKIIQTDSIGTIVRVDADPSIASVKVIKQLNASLSIRKTVALDAKQCPNVHQPMGHGDVDSLEIVKEGTVVVWCFKVTNTGMVPLSPVRLIDLGIGFTQMKRDALDAGASWYVRTRWNATTSLNSEGEAWGYIQQKDLGNIPITDSIIPDQATIIQKDTETLVRIDAVPDEANVILKETEKWKTQPQGLQPNVQPLKKEAGPSSFTESVRIRNSP